MDRLLFIVFAVALSEPTVKPKCPDNDLGSYLLLEGEAFYYDYFTFEDIKPLPYDEITWYKNTSKLEKVSSDEKAKTHYHSQVLFLLDLHPKDSGLYSARYVNSQGECHMLYLNVKVLNASYKYKSDFCDGEIDNLQKNKHLYCPDRVSKTCDALKGRMTWYKNSSLIPGEHNNDLRINNAMNHDQGTYTCVCTWTHNNRTHNTSGCRWLRVDSGTRKQEVHHPPQIHSPTNNEQICDEGSELTLNCSVFCGIQFTECYAYWYVNQRLITDTEQDGYRTKTYTIDDSSLRTFTTSTLTIHKVSAEDFLSEFKCQGFSLSTNTSITLRLKRRESVIPLLIGKLSVLCFCVLAVVLFKCFIIDLTLLVRLYLPVSRYKKDGRAYDAYVVYQMQNLDTATEDSLCHFVMDTLPSVLEEKCGYRLFILGRDDIPGQDLVELVEERIKASRRLMIVLRPGSASLNSMTGIDWQVGFHHALMQTGVKVILIQLGDTGPQGYANLPLSLQHLIRKNPPVKWPEGSRAAAARNSRFWKRVRYLMPAVPLTRCQQLPAVQSSVQLQMDGK